MIEARNEKFWECVPRGAKVETVIPNVDNARGIVVSRIGYMLYTAGGKIHQWESGKQSLYRVQLERPGSLTFDHQGRFIACSWNRVIRVEKNGSLSVMAEGLKAAGDAVYAIDGSIYASDVAGRVLQVTRERGGVGGDASRGAVKVAATDCQWPVGVALSPNQQQLYVTDTTRKVIRVYAIAADGSLEKSREFTALDARGLKTDEAGNVWVVAEGGIHVFDSRATLLGIVRIENPVQLNWGNGFQGLYIATRTAIAHVATRTHGTRTY